MDNFDTAGEKSGRTAPNAAEVVSAGEVAAAHDDNTCTRVHLVLP